MQTCTEIQKCHQRAAIRIASQSNQGSLKGMTTANMSASSPMTSNATQSSFSNKEKPIAVRQSNITAAKQVADVIRTSLGPRGMDKMIRTATGETIVTNDGATILQHMAVLHPCARMLVELSQAQDMQAGDGTTSVVVICGALLNAAEKLLAKGLHPSILSEAFRHSAEKAVGILDSICTPISLSDRSAVMEIAQTSLSSKVVAPYGDLVAGIAVDAVTRVTPKAIDGSSIAEVDLENVRVVRKAGGTIEDSQLVDGLLLHQSHVAKGTPNRQEKARIALIQFCISPPKTDMEGTIVINDYAQMDRVLAEERAYILNICKRIKKSGANVLLIQKSILRDAVNDLALQYLSKLKISVVTNIERDEVDFLARTLHLRPVVDVESLDESVLGSADLLQQVQLASDGLSHSSYIHISGIKDMGPTASVLVRGANALVVDEAARSLHDAMCVVRCLARRGAIICGGGVPEVQMAVKLTEMASTQAASGAQALAMTAFADALLAVPTILAENAGMEPVAVVTALRSQHAQGHQSMGISVRRNVVADMRAEGVFQPLLVSTSAIQLAAETVSMILKIDDIVACR